MYWEGVPGMARLTSVALPLKDCLIQLVSTEG